jgi:diguanylate cyclase (GGDEF)-like protein
MTMLQPPLSSADPVGAAASPETEVQAEQLTLLADRTLMSIKSSFVGIMLVVISQLGHVAWQTLLAFITLRLISMGYNYRLCRQIQSQPAWLALRQGRLNALEWGLFGTGVTWGSAAWMLPHPMGPNLHAHALIIILVGVSAVMMNTAALTRRGIQLFMGGMWGIQFLRILWSYDDPYAYFLLAGSFAYASLSLIHGLQLHAQHHAGMTAEIENRNLLSAMTQQGQSLAEVNAQLAAALARAQELASFDELTGLLNRRAFHERLRIEIAAQRRHGEAATLILLDLDHFKAINDQHGHQVGDAVLRLTAQTLKGLLREVDLLARWGGEEFLIFMPRTSVEEGHKAAERLRMALASACVEPTELHFSASFGVAEMHTGLTLDTALSRADQALYAAKAGGRNQVCLSGSNVTPLSDSSTPWAYI